MKNIHIIAEAGTNHNGNRKDAETLVDLACEAGADSVKFQIIYPEGLYLPKLWNEGRSVDNEVYQKRMSGMLQDDDYRFLANYCKSLGIAFSASVFDKRGVNLLDELDAAYIKVASCDLNNSYFLRQVSDLGRQMVVSTGMASLGEIERAVQDIFSTGNTNLVLMHCVSVYPVEVQNMNLSFIDTLLKAFGLPVGLSDHSESSLAAAIGVAKGVSWIEKHITLDRTTPGFDHAYAMEPASFKQFVKDVRACDEACRLQIHKVQGAESQVKQRARRSIYAGRDIDPGEVIQIEDLLVVRPEGELAPNDLDFILGSTVDAPIYQYQPIRSSLIRKK